MNYTLNKEDFKQIGGIGFVKELSFHQKKIEYSRRLLKEFLLNDDKSHIDGFLYGSNLIHRDDDSYRLLMGPIILSEKSIDSFKLISLDELKKIIADFEKDDDWGDDLAVFQHLIGETFKTLEAFDSSSTQLFYVNMDDLGDEDLLNKEFNSYFLCIIALSISDLSFRLFMHGGD